MFLLWEVVEELRCDLAAVGTAQPEQIECVVTPRLLAHPVVPLSPGLAPPHACSPDDASLHFLEVCLFDWKA